MVMNGIPDIGLSIHLGHLHDIPEKPQKGYEVETDFMYTLIGMYRFL